MKKATKEALDQSIEKWRANCKITDLNDAKVHADDCPLCALFHSNGCAGCPVFQSGHYQCNRTPFDDACDSLSEDDIDGFRMHSKEEVAFLEGLKP